MDDFESTAHDSGDMLDATSPDMGSPSAAHSAGSYSTESKASVSEAEKAAVAQWTKRIHSTKKLRKKKFERMKECQVIANRGAAKDWPDSNYTVPVVKRHINVSVAALYARNPTAVAKQKKKLRFTLWDGNYASLQQAMMSAQGKPPTPGQPPSPQNPAGAPPSMGVPPDPNAMALLQEVQAAHLDEVMMDRAGKTLEILFQYYMNEQDAGYKQQLKGAVRRTKVCAVSWIKLGFQRVLQPNPDVTADIADVTNQIATLKVLLEDYADEKFDENSAKMDELQRLLTDLQSKEEVIVREGPVLGFPKADQVIVDDACVHLKTLAGAEWVAQEFPPMTRDRVKELYGIDIGTDFKSYTSDKRDQAEGAADDEKLAIVWEVQNKKTLQVFTICDGYCSYLKPPQEPDVKVSRFWTLFPIVFNETEDDDDIYPDSDVWDARHMQREYNTVRQGLREHRMQNKPKYGVQRGLLEEADRTGLTSGESGKIIELNALAAGQKVEDILQAIKTVPIDPNLYEVSSVFSDIERAIGSSQADLGNLASATATQSSIVEQGRSVMNSDNVDDLDDVLTDLARAMSELMLLELDIDTVKKIAGPGAVWPQTPPSRQQIAEDLWLEVKAGSSGRPNRAAELANMERGLPYLIQLPGVNPYPLGRRYGELLELDVEDIVIEGMPSVVAQNTLAGRDPFAAGAAGSGPAASPQAHEGAMQGPAGATNAPNPVANEPGPQPGYNAPMATGSAMEAPGVLGTKSAPIPAPRYKASKIPLGPQPA